MGLSLLMSGTKKESLSLIEFGSQDSFAAYSMPGEREHYLVYQNDRQHQDHYDIAHGCFVICPFDMNTSRARYIRQDHVLANGIFNFTSSESIHRESTQKSKYVKDVERILADIKAKEYQKLVYSRVLKVTRPSETIYETFKRLADSLPEAFVFCYHTPDSGCWIGATPEVLIKENGLNYTAQALAGTQVYPGVSQDLIEWGDKEIKEQKYLRYFIRDQLNTHDIPYKEGRTKTIKAGNVLHISTEYSFPKSMHIIDIADCLHPSPAICGTPQRMAFDRIEQYEDHKREDYCGFIGPLNILGESSLYVNLRSMKVYDEHVLLFLGGGITDASDPILEWEETENKSLTLLNVLQKSSNA